MDGAKLRLNLRFTLVGATVLPQRGVLSTPNCDFLQTPLQVLPALADRLDQKSGRGGADIERIDPAPPGQGGKAVAGVGDAWADPLPLTAEDENGRPREVDRPGRVLGVGVGAPDPVAGRLRLGRASRRDCGRGRSRGARPRPPRPCRRPRSPRPSGVRGSTTPAAPANSAERQTAPRLRGSWTWSRATSSESSSAAGALRLDVGIGVGFGDDALVVGRAAEPLQLLGRGLGRAPDPPHRPPPPFGLLDRALAVDDLAVVGHAQPLRHQAGALGGVADLPAELGEAVADLVGAVEVLRRPRFLAFVEQRVRPPPPPRPRPRRASRGRGSRASRAAPPALPAARSGSPRRPARRPRPSPAAC